ncbi:MAG: hypothetical protein ACLPKB_33300 [Xanthobacteraceae bacterium]
MFSAPAWGQARVTGQELTLAELQGVVIHPRVVRDLVIRRKDLGGGYKVWIFAGGTLTNLRTFEGRAFKRMIVFARGAEGFICTAAESFARENGVGDLARAGAVDSALITGVSFKKISVLPVRITSFSIPEEAFDSSLNPIRAKISLGFRNFVWPPTCRRLSTSS